MILIISSSRDFATDYVIAQLLERQEPYVRIDLDLLADEQVCLDPVSPRLTLTREGKTVVLEPENIQSIYYRAPTHLCESSGGRYQPTELLARHQWAAFARSLMVFDSPFWVNHPWQTYRAESKPLQLRSAALAGLLIPETRICNAAPPAKDVVWRAGHQAVVKALDSFIVRVSEHEDAFFYTRSIMAAELEAFSLAEMPVILQERIEPKTDLRVTVVGDQVFPVAILLSGQGIEGDWRLKKTSVEYRPYALPLEVRTACVTMMRNLGLVFGAIDLAVRDGEHFFLEINPTGEWAWLVDQLGLPIGEVIADALCAGRVPKSY
jgi:hypothetical protein